MRSPIDQKNLKKTFGDGSTKKVGLRPPKRGKLTNPAKGARRKLNSPVKA